MKRIVLPHYPRLSLIVRGDKFGLYYRRRRVRRGRFPDSGVVAFDATIEGSQVQVAIERGNPFAPPSLGVYRGGTLLDSTREDDPRTWSARKAALPAAVDPVKFEAGEAVIELLFDVLISWWLN